MAGEQKAVPLDLTTSIEDNFTQLVFKSRKLEPHETKMLTWREFFKFLLKIMPYIAMMTTIVRVT